MLKALKRCRAPYLSTMPFLILFFVFQLVSTVQMFYISLTDWKGIGIPDFCGFDNYRKTPAGDMLWESLGNTVVYWLTGLVFTIRYALLTTPLLNSRYLKSNSARTFFKMATSPPNICAATAMGLAFQMPFDKNMGLVDELVTIFGGSRPPWLTSTAFSKIPVTILNIQRYALRFTMILLLELINIPKDYYEAATVDGTNEWWQLWFIALSSLENILFPRSITLTADMRKLFNESYILPGPGTSSSSLFQYVYESDFSVFDMDYTSTIGVISILILIVISIIQFVVKYK